jgi:hypothetical protein
MRLKFSRAVAAGREVYLAGKEYEVKDQHAAEVYVSHGYAEVVGTAPANMGETLKRGHPASEPKPGPAPASTPKAPTK